MKGRSLTSAIRFSQILDCWESHKHRRGLASVAARPSKVAPDCAAIPVRMLGSAQGLQQAQMSEREPTDAFATQTAKRVGACLQ